MAKRIVSVVIDEELLDKIASSIPTGVSKSQYMNDLIAKGLCATDLTDTDAELSVKLCKALNSIVSVANFLDKYKDRFVFKIKS